MAFIVIPTIQKVAKRHNKVQKVQKMTKNYQKYKKKANKKCQKGDFCCIRATIHTRWEIQCLPYGGFLDAQASQDEIIVINPRTDCWDILFVYSLDFYTH